MPRPEFVNLSMTGIWSWMILCGGGCPVYCGMFSSFPGLCPLNANNTLT